MRPIFDEKDQAILDQRIATWDKRSGPRVGDFVEMPDGALLRFTHDWGSDIQTTCRKMSGDVSFYFGNGYMSFSGSLDPAICKSKLTQVASTMPGNVWFFHHNERRAHNGVYFKIPCRVYRYQP
jgi:hypothetical protein